ncbi:exodeoxyribonuclease VII large subunit (plasmid) [Acidihalobacter aeolianus]|uniref:Exodeoxyribonuclease VII large subunit n=1 Tax=Acidihalobacter aeolianus TaxID=2792603 RepID=A0A1D8KCV9_9GAMM|nr:exodeoxyribonuclease VII large subunit [Acidihalobacter aeolianus]AOV18772.1 exodeoxyribonuclease VII large subunit [Acidihalobacter aeolianus]
MTQLNVPFQEKEAAKALGARWNPAARQWYVPEGVSLEPFSKWLPAEVAQTLPDVLPTPGIGLTEYLARLSAAVAKAAPKPEWVRVEVSELRERNGSVYLQFVEHAGGDRGTLMSKATGVIWESHKAVVERFCRETGASLAAGIKLLVEVQAKFDTKFGVSLIVSNIDPAYTLGDMAAKLRKIEQTLRAEGVFELNRQKAPPTEFTRVLVIAPVGAAGLGDFRRDADRLQELGLVHFEYFEALFQGERAPGEIRDQIRIATEYAIIKPADALVIIRGGGAVSDLHWLNDEDLARAVCTATIPVFTGIGHERDETILDRVAARRFDTPSKVIGHIAQRVIANATEAQDHYRTICGQAQRQLDLAAEMSLRYIEQVRAGTSHQIDLQADRAMAWHAAVTTGAGNLVEQMAQTTAHLSEAIGQGAKSKLEAADQRAARQYSEIRETASRRLTEECHRAETLHRTVLQLANQIIDQVAGHADDSVRVTRERVSVRIERAAEQARSLIEITLGLGPAATVQRGYVIARDQAGNVVTSQTRAAQQKILELEFRDGRVTVTPVQEQ